MREAILLTDTVESLPAENRTVTAGEAETAEPREEGRDWNTDVATGAGARSIPGEVSQASVPVATHVVQTLMDESDSMAEYRDVREQIKLRKRNAAAIATTREFLIGQGDTYKGITPEAGIKLLDEAGILEQLTAKLIERHLS
jgi:hypothetical protein